MEMTVLTFSMSNVSDAYILNLNTISLIHMLRRVNVKLSKGIFFSELNFRRHILIRLQL